MDDLKKIVFTQHASFQLKYRGITRKQTSDCIRYPDKVIQQSRIRRRALHVILQKRKHHALIVIYDQSQKDIIVITAFITSKLKKYL